MPPPSSPLRGRVHVCRGLLYLGGHLRPLPLEVGGLGPQRLHRALRLRQPRLQLHLGGLQLLRPGQPVALVALAPGGDLVIFVGKKMGSFRFYCENVYVQYWSKWITC